MDQASTHSFGDFLSRWPWTPLALISIISVVAIALIIVVTRSSILKMASAAAGLVVGGRSRRDTDVDRPLRAEGRARARFDPRISLVGLERRIVASDDDADTARRCASDLVEGLAALGVDLSDIREEELARDGEGALIVRFVVVEKDDARSKAFGPLALRTGFRETRGPRQLMTLAGFRDELGRRAIDDAVANMRTVQEQLNLHGRFELVEARLSTMSAGEDGAMVEMHACIAGRMTVDDQPGA